MRRQQRSQPTKARCTALGADQAGLEACPVRQSPVGPGGPAAARLRHGDEERLQRTAGDSVGRGGSYPWICGAVLRRVSHHHGEMGEDVGYRKRTTRIWDGTSGGVRRLGPGEPTTRSEGSREIQGEQGRLLTRTAEGSNAGRAEQQTLGHASSRDRRDPTQGSVIRLHVPTTNRRRGRATATAPQREL